MISQPDRPWCPSCSESRWSYQLDDAGACKDCETTVVEEWPLWARARRRAGQAVIVTVAGALYLGPPLWAIGRALTYDGPLWATRTVTVTRTQEYGLIPDLLGIAPLYFLLLIITVLALSGVMPRRI